MTRLRMLFIRSNMLALHFPRCDIGNFVSLALLLLPVLALPTARPTVVTTSGSYVGATNEQAGVETFFGLRYAEPPLGALRFATPVAITKPPTIQQDATSFGSACAQQVWHFVFECPKALF